MNIILNGKFVKFFISIPIFAEIRVDIPLEFLLRGKIRGKIFEVLSAYNFNGTVKIDNNSWEFVNGVVKDTRKENSPK